MCHFSAYRRGVVGRELTAAFTEAAPYLSFERYAPAHGMNAFQLQATFQDLHLPAVVYDLEHTLPDVASVVTGSLPDRQSTAERAAKSTDTTTRTLYDQNLYPIACMYLNSGLPVLVGTDDDHAMTLVGWFRDCGDVRFVVNDDTEGPTKTAPPKRTMVEARSGHS